MEVQEREQLQQRLDIKEGKRSYWRLDPRTIERGKEGVRAAREALREGQQRRAQSLHHRHAA
jgi:hypothetical protein